MASLTRREFLNRTAATAAASLLPGVLSAASPATSLYANATVIDGLGEPGGPSMKQGEALGKAELDDVAASGLTAVHLTVGAVGTMAPLEAFEKTVRGIARWEGEIDAHPEVLARVRGAGDLEQARSRGVTGLVYGVQDGVSFEDDLERLVALHQLGLRVVQPTYNRRNLLGDGCMEPADAGLSRTGFDAVERLNELGMLVDLSHCGRRTAMDAIGASKRPVAFTHTGCYALVEHPRHRTDDELRAVADTGGVSGIFIMPYLSKGRQPAAADVIAHLEHAVQVAGEDHVSLGTDGYVSPTELTPGFRQRHQEITRERQRRGIAAPFETEEGFLFASDLNTPRRFETLAGLLLERGHSEARVAKILGGNLARVFGEVWRESRDA